MENKEKDILFIYKQQVLRVLKSPQIKFLLFGSRSRGDADEFSDYDILIITSLSETHVKDKIEEIEFEMFATYNAIINSHLFSEAEIQVLSFEPFIINALNEEIAA